MDTPSRSRWRTTDPAGRGVHRELRIQQLGDRLVGQAWYQAASRWGLLVRGLAYCAIGVLALLAAFDLGGDFLNTAGVMERLTSRPFGRIALVLMLAGNLGYMLFKLVGALWDTDGKGTGAIGLLKRLGMFLRGLFHAGLSLLAIDLLRGVPHADGTGDTYAQAVAARLFTWHNGAWLVIALGAYLVVLAALQVYGVHTAYFRRQLRLEDMSVRSFRVVTALGRMGMAARAAVALLMGAFMILAGRQHDASVVHGLGGVLAELAKHAVAPLALTLLALGLCAYGVFEILLVRYRRLSVHGPYAASPHPR